MKPLAPFASAAKAAMTGGLGLFTVLVLQTHCAVDQAPAGLRATPPGSGPTVVFDLEHQPLPEIPQPNDVATFADPTSRTGRRINVSAIAPTEMEESARAGFASMEGWGTFAPLTVAFTREAGSPPTDAAIDLANVRARMQNDGHDFTNDPVYVINLTTGVPVVLDMGEGNFPLTPHDLDAYWPNDPKIDEENILFESYEEDPGVMQSGYAPSMDVDFDGILDHPNTFGPLPTGQIHGVDDLLTWYERETDTLILRPLLPMEEKTEYAVVLTDRLTGPDGQPARSPFTYVNHPEQTADLAKLRSILSSPTGANYYGDIAGTGAAHIAFAWTFTTGPVYEDLRLLRDGLYGKGPFGSIATQFPAKAEAFRAVGLATQPSDENVPLETQPQCAAGLKTPFAVNVASATEALDLIVEVVLKSQFSLTTSQQKELEASFASIDHFVIGQFQSPYFLGTDPAHENPEESFELDYRTGKGRVTSDTVPFFLAVPKATATAHAPFPTVMWAHGTSLFAEEAIMRVGYFARQGLATFAIDMPGHGLFLSDGEQRIAQIALGTSCSVEWLNGLNATRAYDLNGDGKPDSGGYLWTSHIFHSRDNIRQSVVDEMQGVRLLRSFDGSTRSDQDFNGDGKVDLAGDFDGDGTPDIGGPTAAIYSSGNSYGGIVAMIHGAVDPYVAASAPISGGGGLTDIAAHSSLVPTPVLEQIFSPLVIAVPASSRGSGAKLPTACKADQMSLRLEVNSLFDSAELEVACLNPSELGPDMTVLVANSRNKVWRCARTDSQGLLRIPISANVGDPLSIEIYAEHDAVESYKTCSLQPGVSAARTVSTWEQPATTYTAVASGGTCPSSAGCQLFWTTFFPVGSALVAPQEGLGYARQTPDVRRLFTLTQAALDPADPIDFAPYYMMRTIPGLDGEPLPHRGILVSNTIGDPSVPVAAGNAFARAAGVLPFLPPQAAETMPAYADYATPAALYEAFGNQTANDVLLANHVLRGMARLEQTHAGPRCGVNVLPNPPASLACGAPATVSSATCAETLFDADWASEGLNLYDAPHSNVPLRLGRSTSVHATDATSLAHAWAPRISALAPGATDGPAGNEPLLGLVNAYVNPLGQHVFVVNDPCRSFDDVTYYDTMLVRFLASGGTDIYPLSHPQTHGCMATQSCAFE